MTTATRRALLRVRDILIDAGWIDPPPENAPVTPPLTILYRNHKGEVAPCRIIPRHIFHGTELPWHPEPTWLIEADDIDKGTVRTFAVANILHWATYEAAGPESGGMA